MVIIRKKHQETADEKEARLQEEREKAAGIQDQYQAKGFELVSWVQANKVLVTCLIGLFVVGGISFSGYVFYKARKAEEASSAYLEVLKSLDGVSRKTPEEIEKWKGAQEKLTAVAATHSGASVSVLANLYAAHLALENGDAKKSLELYEQAVKNLSKSDPLHPLGLIGLGYAQEKNGDANAALISFETVIDAKSKIGEDLALFEAARIAKAQNEQEKSKKYVARLLEEYPGSIYESNAKRLN